MALTVGDFLLNQQFSPGGTQNTFQAPNPYTPSAYDQSNAQAVISGLAARLSNLEKSVKLQVSADTVISQILLTQDAALISSDKIAIVGEVTFADWHRTISGQIAGGIDPSITQIIGGVIKTGKVQSFDGLSWLNLDATGATPFIQCQSSVTIDANGAFTFGASTGKQVVWDGTNLTVGGNSLMGTSATPLDTLIGTANGALQLSNFGTELSSVLTAGTNNIMAATAAGTYYASLQGTYAMFADRAAVLNGAGPTTAGNKLALGIDASGLIAGYNAATTGTWVTTLLMDTTAGNLMIGNGANALIWNSSANTLTLGSGSTTGVVISGSGSATFAGTLSAVTGNFGAITVSPAGSISSGQTAYNTGAGFWLEANSGTPRISIGNGTNSLTWDGTNLNINSSALISGTSAYTVMSNASYGPLAYSGLSGKLNKNASDVLGGNITFTSAGAFQIGTATWDGTTAAGTGIMFNEHGIVAVNAGALEFVLNGSTGAATFSGALSAATGTFVGDITTSGHVYATGAYGTYSAAISGEVGAATAGGFQNNSSTLYTLVADNQDANGYALGIYGTAAFLQSGTRDAIQITQPSADDPTPNHKSSLTYNGGETKFGPWRSYFNHAEWGWSIVYNTAVDPYTVYPPAFANRDVYNTTASICAAMRFDVAEGTSGQNFFGIEFAPSSTTATAPDWNGSSRYYMYDSGSSKGALIQAISGLNDSSFELRAANAGVRKTWLMRAHTDGVFKIQDTTANVNVIPADTDGLTRLAIDGYGNVTVNAHATTYSRVTSGTSYQIPNGIGSVFLDSALGTFTLTMPQYPADGQEVSISSWYNQTALTHAAYAGQVMQGALSATMGSGTGGTWKFMAATGSWWRMDKAV